MIILANRLMMAPVPRPAPFAATTYTGNSLTQSIVNDLDLSTDGGLVIIKNRDQADSHVWVDTVRGATKVISSDSGAAQTTDTYTVTGFNDDGFNIGSDAKVNTNTESYISWSFKVEVGFFDIVSWVGDGTSTVTKSHSLNDTPGFIVVKNLSDAGSFFAYHNSIDVNGDSAPETDVIFLSGNAAASQFGASYWADTAPTDTDFTINSGINVSGKTYVAYLFAHNPSGHIQCGGYTGNGSATGPTISLGKRPKWIMIKRWDSTGDWVIYDDARDTSNPNTAYLLANSSAAEAAGLDVDFNDTGFQIKTPTATVNATSGKYLYIAVTE